MGECEINSFTHSNKTFTENLIKHLFFYAACTISRNCHQHAKVQISQVLDGMMRVCVSMCVSAAVRRTDGEKTEAVADGH